MAARRCTSIERVSAFARAARHYWLSVLPCARAELGVWRRHAARIPDRLLREAALDALDTKSDFLEGAVAFAAFTRLPTRRGVIRAITAFEIAFDYLDTIAELPNPDPIANARSLGQALLDAFGPDREGTNYYAHLACRDDAGYLKALVNTCRAAFEALPSSSVVSKPALHAISRIVTYQSLNHGDARGSHEAFREWACSHCAPGVDLQWWEIGAAMGSQLYVFALIAAAADRSFEAERISDIEHAYFPWVGALSTLLDSVVDQRMDGLEGQRSLIDYYGSPQIVVERMRMMAVEARRLICVLPDAENHILILSGMAALFHSVPQASVPEVGMVTRSVLDAVGVYATPALLFLRTRRALSLNSVARKAMLPGAVGHQPTNWSPGY